MACDPSTRGYVKRRTQEGLSKKEILRCLKRYIAPAALQTPTGSCRCTRNALLHKSA
jgi:hypothetical protein